MGHKRGKQASKQAKTGPTGRRIDESTSSRVRCQSERLASYIHSRCLINSHIRRRFPPLGVSRRKRVFSFSPSSVCLHICLLHVHFSFFATLLFLRLGMRICAAAGLRARHKRQGMEHLTDLVGFEHRHTTEPANGQTPCTHAAPTDSATFPGAASVGRHCCSFLSNLGGLGCFWSLAVGLPVCLSASNGVSNLRSACPAPHTRGTLSSTDRTNDQGPAIVYFSSSSFGGRCGSVAGGIFVRLHCLVFFLFSFPVPVLFSIVEGFCFFLRVLVRLLLSQAFLFCSGRCLSGMRVGRNYSALVLCFCALRRVAFLLVWRGVVCHRVAAVQ
ncbi:hypothetical protein IWX49DRAFT_105327 [Phyllosticta citricarpa]|uniref:Transmembrane protein n=1 Tax=Phyllosticta paracitricarpa TaxID=2016321 RepID=A0ABR1NJA4_9PEZI